MSGPHAVAGHSPFAFLLTCGNRNGVTQLMPLLDAIPPAYLAFRRFSRGFLDRSDDVRITSDPIPKSHHT
ncbi:hypothetical protein GCM10010503_39650 [Streptomyces lucensis JCM 4490]|uniref:Uncharacterized protein n=1 Tax=Streptomyces lucensis JCM 4490 TaxID=1306176 RepID=A0A918MSA1_9ACTN|nr:hypothetical protein GCM10010503_39650 [Streptomyces lucensis JCM 4490]